MKRLIGILCICAIFGLLYGCTNTEKQNEILDYVNNDSTMLGEIEQKLNDSYNSVVGNNFDNDLKAYEELSSNTINLAKDLNVKANEVAQKYFNNSEILEVHNVYLQYVTSYMNAVSYMLAAIENQNREFVIKANNEISSANSTGILWKSKLNDLCTKYKVKVSFKINN